MLQIQEERLWAAAKALKSGERLIEQTVEYARNRQAFGKSILDNQVVHFRLAELATEIELLRSLTYRACELYVAGQDVTRLASMAKLKAGRLGREVRCHPGRPQRAGGGAARRGRHVLRGRRPQEPGERHGCTAAGRGGHSR